jgi:cell division transport system ATP-binding protein
LIQFQSVSKAYSPEITAVKDITFKIDSGEFVFLIGPSGSGKTTIIKMLIRDELPSAGKIYFDDYDITRLSRRKVYKIRREVGVIFQDFKLIADKTAFENVAFAMEAAGKKNKEIRERVPYLLDIVGLSDRLDAFPKELSGGEQQRVAIARAISNNPRILIADEPTGNLDPASAWDIVQVLNKINNWGTTVMMSTHGTDIVNSMNKRVIQMAGGEIIRDDREGKYEMNSKFENEVLGKNVATEKKKSKTKYKVNLKTKAAEEKNPTEKNEKTLEDKEDTTEPVKQKKFHFFKFRKNQKDEESTDELKMILGQDVEEEENKEIVEDAPKEEKKEEPKNKDKKNADDKSDDKKETKEDEKKPKTARKEKEGDGLHLNLSAGLAGEIKDKKQLPEEPKKEIPETDIDVSKLSVTELDIPAELVKDLQKSGYKTVQQIVDEGPEGLSSKLAIDPEEVVLVASAIGKILKR